ncbi:MAG: PhoH family protein, partial [Ruminococcus sp.]|nr:PhoH family protein [Ruminococcus sp.]
MAEKKVHVENAEQLSALFGQLDGNVSNIQKQYNVTVVSRDGDLKIIGDEPAISDAAKALEALLRMSGKGQPLSEQTIRYVTSMVADGIEKELEELGGDGICLTSSGKIVRPRTVGQKRYLDSIKNNTIVLGIGPAGTGKT